MSGSICRDSRNGVPWTTRFAASPTVAIWSFPINLATFEQLVGHEATEDEFKAYLEEKRVPIPKPSNSEEVIVSQVGWELYEKFFLGYTLKQWKKHPKELDASVCGRIPIRTNRDDRYLRERFQALPRDGYHRLFENLVAAIPGCEIRLETVFEEIRSRVRYDHLIYTGPVDAYFEFRFGRLPTARCASSQSRSLQPR